jgi:cell wall-associated NlpC family hydrolase
MKSSTTLCLAVAISLLTAGPTSLQAQFVKRHKKHKSTAQATPSPSPSPTPTPTPEPTPSEKPAASAAVATIDASEIDGFDAQPEPIRQLLSAALALTTKNLTYTYGSSDPASGGLDCSGTIYYLLNQAGFTDVPRQASAQYEWVRLKSHFYAVLSKQQDNPELREMRPGDLLFWTGTYQVDADPPVTHTMIYLGRRKRDGHRLMVGASDGRSYDGQKRNGVSVFDFTMPAAHHADSGEPAPDHAPDFAGYGPIPGMASLNDLASRQTEAAHSSPESEHAAPSPDAQTSPAATPKRKHHASQADSG